MQAFVAMRFSSDPWRDKPYQVIKTELENAGYVCQRSDELKTSGPVVDEVCRLLTDADLVVIDSSGDSHSVSYEIGFCHGSGRPHDRTLLIRDNDDLPFNYRHYRHRVYRDLRHLRRLIRGYLALNEPLGLDEYGYSFSFPMSDDGGFGYIREGAHLIFNCLSSIQFSGRCECYAGEIFWLRRFVVGVMLRPTRGEKTPSLDFWRRICSQLDRETLKADRTFSFDRQSSELAEKRAMLEHLLPCGTAEFEAGRVSRVLGSPDDEGSFFRSYGTDAW